MKKNFSIAVSLMVLVNATPVFALEENQQKLITIIDKIAGFMGTVFLSVAIMMFLRAGYEYWQAGGKTENVTKAHQNLLWAVVGTAVGLLAWVAPDMIQKFISQ